VPGTLDGGGPGRRHAPSRLHQGHHARVGVEDHRQEEPAGAQANQPARRPRSSVRWSILNLAPLLARLAGMVQRIFILVLARSVQEPGVCMPGKTPLPSFRTCPQAGYVVATGPLGRLRQERKPREPPVTGTLPPPATLLWALAGTPHQPDPPMDVNVCLVLGSAGRLLGPYQIGESETRRLDGSKPGLDAAMNSS